MKYYILALISALGLSACSLIGESGSDCPDLTPEKTETIALSFKMISANIGSRADASHVEVDSEWPSFEDLIDIRNFAFYIFLDNDESYKPLVMKMTNIAGSTNPNQMITGAYGAYTVTTVIPKHNLEDLLGRELDINSSNPVKFRIVLLANAPSGTNYNLLAPVDPITAGSEGAPTTYDEFMENANDLVFNINDIYSPVENDGLVNGIYKGTIPMFGMSTFTTTEEQLYLSRPEERIYLGDIYMLRSLAKIRVIDRAPRTNGIYPYVKAVTVSGSTYMAYQLPADVSNDSNNPAYTNGSQVHTPHIHPRPDATANTTYRLGYLTEGTKTTRFGYLPEQPIAYSNPVIHITAQLDANREKTYDIPMTGSNEYSLAEGSFGSNILRNHIYTLEVNSISSGTPVDITLRVAPWVDVDNELNYTDNVTVSNPLTWNPGTYEGTVDENNSIVNIRPWATAGDKDVQQPLVGTFGIQTPVGATWNASFIDRSDSYGSFAFLQIDPDDPQKKEFIKNEDGTYATFPAVSGLIDGKTLSTIYIVSTNPRPEKYQRARLQVLVALPDGTTVIEADLCPEKQQSNYTIVQSPL